MKGYIIFENFNKLIECKEIIDGGYTCVFSGCPNGEFSGVINRATGARCNKDDTYDFETGALIALMKMCKFDKSYKAIEEAFKYNSYDTKKTKELEEENENLKKRINELENYNNQLEERVAGEQRGGYKLLKDMEKLQHEYDLCLNSENALKITTQMQNKSIEKLTKAIDGYKQDLYKVTKRCEELEIKEAILNKQEETINKREEEMSVYFGGRGCGKQYKALVSLFKKLDQKKVDAAYKEAYNTTLPVWQKEVLNQMYGVYKESKEKTELPKTLDINGTVYRKSIQIKDFSNDQLDSLIEGSRAFTRKCVDEWLYKLSTKREEMWEKIFELHKESDVIIKVKREDINTFLHEIGNKFPEITWASGVKIFEAKYTIGDIYFALKTCDEIYFRLSKETKLSYSSDEFTYAFKGFKYIDYLPPMRWDLFKKGRIVIGVKNNNELEEFRKEVERNTGIKDIPMCPTNLCLFYSFDKDNYKIILESVEKPNIAKINNHKIVYWEDVR